MDLGEVSGKRIVLGVCGGIAAYKVVEVARALTKAGADVRVVMTDSAKEFVGEITFSTLTGNRVVSELFEKDAPSEIPHTSLARSADLVVVAPATAKTMAKYASGATDDLISTLLLSFKGRIVMAPAMHTEMWENPSTQENVRILAGRGVRFVGPEAGALAGPDIGLGRLSEPDQILGAIVEEIKVGESLSSRTVLVTAGGTREPIDSVRYIGNRSSGKMGFAIAHEALDRGAKVILITGPSHLPHPERAEGAEVIEVKTAQQMHSATMRAAETADIVIMAAAVADWRPSTSSVSKLKKKDGPPSFTLEATPDILAELGADKRDGQVLVGFSAETEDLEANARSKLDSKSVDMIVANLVNTETSGFDADTNAGLILGRDGYREGVEVTSKRLFARRILDALSARYL